MEDERNTFDGPTEEILETIANARRLTREYYLTDYKEAEKKKQILTELLGKLGDNVAIDTPFYCDYGKNIFIGDNVIININCTFVDNSKITIGNHVLIASNVQLYTASHPTAPEERLICDWQEKGCAWFSTYSEPITIKDGAWLGGGVIVLPGVTIGENAVIGAGSVVTRSIPDNCVAVGNPCKPIRYFEKSERR